MVTITHMNLPDKLERNETKLIGNGSAWAHCFWEHSKVDAEQFAAEIQRTYNCHKDLVASLQQVTHILKHYTTDLYDLDAIKKAETALKAANL